MLKLDQAQRRELLRRCKPSPAEWLLDYLNQNGPQRRPSVLAAGARAGLNQSAVDRAKYLLGRRIRSTMDVQGAIWSLAALTEGTDQCLAG